MHKAIQTGNGVFLLVIIQTSVSVKRLSKFLQNEELDPNFIDWTLEPEDSMFI